jgi:peptidoglycan/LPS O-acetylase OafA/YrhL
LKQSNSDYIYGIDIVRFACALSVAAFHLTWHNRDAASFMPFGWVGVQVFFVISGLVIANSADGASARQFLVSRFLRIYPAAWCAILVNFPLVLWGCAIDGTLPRTAQWHGFWFGPLFYSTVLLRGPFLATAYWTLPIEISFYILVFLLIKAHSFKRVQWLATALILWGGPYLIALALNSCGLVHWAWVDIGYGWKNMSLMRHGPYFGLGILIWLFKEKRISKTGAAAAGLALFLGFIEIYSRAVELVTGFARAAGTAQMPTLRLVISSNIAFCVAFALVFLSVRLNHLFPANVAARNIVRFLGLTTYPFYLLHETLGRFAIYQASRIGLAYLPSTFVALGCIGAVSLLIAMYCEPALRSFLKQKIALLRPKPLQPTWRTTSG